MWVRVRPPARAPVRPVVYSRLRLPVRLCAPMCAYVRPVVSAPACAYLCIRVRTPGYSLCALCASRRVRALVRWCALPFRLVLVCLLGALACFACPLRLLLPLLCALSVLTWYCSGFPLDALACAGLLPPSLMPGGSLAAGSLLLSLALLVVV